MQNKLLYLNNRKPQIEKLNGLIEHPSVDYQIEKLKKNKEYMPNFKISTSYKQHFHNNYKKFQIEYDGDLEKLDFIIDELNNLKELHILNVQIQDWNNNTIPDQIISLAEEIFNEFPKKYHNKLEDLIRYLDYEQREIFKYLTRLKEAQKDDSWAGETLIDENIKGLASIEALRILHKLGVMDFLKTHYHASPEDWAALFGSILGKNENTLTRQIRSFFTDKKSGGDSNDFREGRLNERSLKILKNLDSVKKVK